MSRRRSAAWVRAGVLLALLPLGVASPRAQSAPRDAAAVRPYRTGTQDPVDFRGPGRDDPEPEVEDVVLGWFGPGDPDHPAFGTLWRGAILAVERENAAGGYRGAPGSPLRGSSGKPFRLVPVWSETPWQGAIGALVRLVYEDQAWALVGGVDGATTHLALQVALKSHILLLTPGSTDVSTDEANVPWLFSLPPSDDALAAAVVPALAKEAAGGPFVVTASADHDGHAALAAFRRELGRRRLAPAGLVEFPSGGDDLGTAAERAIQSAPRAVLVLGSAGPSGAFVAALRHAGFAGAILGSATTAGRAFRSASGNAAAVLCTPGSLSRGTAWDAFSIEYERRWHEPPDEWAANGHDAVTIVVGAIRRAGLNRIRIRDAVHAAGPWDGAGGTVRWDPLGRNQRPVSACLWSEGRLVTRHAPRGVRAQEAAAARQQSASGPPPNH